MSELKFKFLKDTPISTKKGKLFDFYHNNVAPALDSILKNETCVHTIGLFGRWGSGKSTIIDLMEEKCSDILFIFDAWKYQEDSLRRIFLIKLVDFLIEKKIPVPKEILNPVYKEEIRGSSVAVPVREHKTFWQKVLSYLKKYAIFSVLFVAWIIAQYLQPEIESGLFNNVKIFLGVSTYLTFILTLLIPFIGDILKKAIDEFFSNNKPLTELRITIEKEERLNSPEQFERLFSDILGYIKDKKIIIVFDNIDRVQGDTAIKMLATIKTFLEPKNQSNLIFIVPCDSEAIIKQIEAFYKNQKDSSFDSSEYLRKIFNLIIWTPEFIASDLQKYTKSLLEETGDVSTLFNNEDLISVINFAFSNNPREIKQFINNLIASLAIASKTEVNDIIESNIPYLAKVLVLRQKYPNAYKRLRDKWYDPENIIEGGDVENMPGFREFMLNTSRISVLDAEPFIYFKRPLTPKGITDPEKLKLALINESTEECINLINADNIKDVLDYATDLLRKYKIQPGILIKIFNTQIKVVANFTNSIDNRSYLDANLEVIESSLWANFETFPTDLVFDLILGNKNTQQSIWRQSVLERYVTSLNSDVLKDGKNTSLVKSIVAGFAKHSGILSTGQFVQIKKSIQENFSTIYDVVALFNTEGLQDKFLTQEALIKFITSFERANFTEQNKLIILLQHAISKYGLEEKLIIRLADILKEETLEHPNIREEKELLVKDIQGMLETFKAFELFKPDNESWNILTDRLLEAVRAIEGWDNRWMFIPILRQIESTEAKNQDINGIIKSFLQDASSEKIERLLGVWSVEIIQEFIEENLEVFVGRIKDGKLLRLIYSKASGQSRDKIIQQVISELGADCVEFVKEVKEDLPNKIEAVRLLLEKGSAIPLGEAVLIYHELIPELVNKNSPLEVKALISEKATVFLKSDTPAEQDIGKIFLEMELLSKEAKREVIKELLSWLRAPGKVVTYVHAIALGLVASLFDILQITLRNDFIYTLFDMIRAERDHDTIKASIGILEQLKLAYKDYEKDFNDLLERLSIWPDNEDKRLVIDSLKSFQKDLAKKLDALEKTEESLSEPTATH